jgi:hypothetical protein
MKTKQTTKSKPKSYWDHLTKPQTHKAKPKHKAADKPQPKAKAMTAQAEATAEPRETEEEFLPPPDPPVNPSPPRDPPAPDEVNHQNPCADPEVETVVRELDLVIEGTRGEGPAPEDPIDEGEEARLKVEEPAE